MEVTKGLGHRYLKGVTKYFFLFESWFSSKRLAEAAIDVDVEIIGMVKINA